MDSNISELVKSGHERAADLKASCGAVDVRSVAQLISDLASQLEVQYVRSNALAAENAGLIRSSEALLHEASEVYRAYNKTQLPDGDLVDEQSLQDVYDVINATPATDALLAEMRASVLDEFAIAQDEQAKKYYELSPGCSGQNECQFAAGQARYSAECMRKLAAQLRKGDAL